MSSIGEHFARERRRLGLGKPTGPNPLVEKRELLLMQELPPTQDLEHAAQTIDETLRRALAEMAADESGDATPNRRLSVLQTRLIEANARLQLGLRRDSVQEGRPDGCWCLGLGGRDERGFLVPGDDEPRFCWSTFCPCPDGQRAEADKTAALSEAAEARQRARLTRFWAGVPTEYASCTLRSFLERENGQQQRQLVGRLRDWVGLQNEWLVLHGSAGRGKTGLAVACAKAVCETQHKAVLYASAQDLLDKLRHSYADAEAARESTLLDNLYSVDLLLLDDLGTENHTPWATDRIRQVVDHRYRENKRTIITSNYDLEEMAERMAAPALQSRIGQRCDSKTWVIDLSALPSLRIKKQQAA